jgi:hypothetical protein
MVGSMRRLVFWIGIVLGGLGLALLVASAVMRYMGYDASYNLGDPTKFEFILVPLWQVGLAVAILGALSLLGWRKLKRTE